MAGETQRLLPPWLEPLLGTPFFSTCATHGDAPRGECNMFCLDCPAAAALCFYCRCASHSDHRTIQIRRSSYHDVVRVSEVQGALDVSGVQTYVINSARVVFLNERPLPKGTAASCFGAAAKYPVHVCETCARALLDPFRFCSLGCKLQGIKKGGGDACFALVGTEGSVVVVGGGGGPLSPAVLPSTAASTATKASGDRMAAPEQRGGPPAGREDGKGLCASTSTDQQHKAQEMIMCPARPPSINPRRRKGVPRRAPLAS